MSLSLEEILPLLTKGGAIKAAKTVYEYLSPVDRALLKQRIDELNIIRAEKTTLTGAAKRTWQGDKSRRIGAKFEELIEVLFINSEVIKVQMNQRGTVGEYDVVISLQPLKNTVPFLENHQQALGEAKCHENTVSSDWVQELLGNLTQSQVTLGFIFVFTKPKRLPVPTQTALYGVRAGGRVILPFGAKQFGLISDGSSLLEVFEDMHSMTTIVNSKIMI